MWTAIICESSVIYKVQFKKSVPLLRLCMKHATKYLGIFKKQNVNDQ